MVDNKILAKFLVKAKIKTYAGSGEGAEKKLGNGGRELTFEEGDFSYRDIYFGFNPFAGEEVVWENGKCIWVMNYCGKIIGSDLPEKEIYEFLQKAMKLIDEERPLRGPQSFKEGNLEYLDNNEGDINSFNGVEKIFYCGKLVYRLYYHGGLVCN